MREWKHSSMCS